MLQPIVRLCALLLACGIAHAADPATQWDSLRVQVGTSRSAAGIWVPKGGPGKKARLIVWFHGGMQSGKCEKGYEAAKALMPWISAKGVVIASPSACMDRHWLTPAGLDAMESLLDTVIRRYPIDTARLELVGVSDGGLAVLHYSLKGRRHIAKRTMVSTYGGMVIPQEAIAQAAPGLSSGSWTFLQGGKDQLMDPSRARPWIEAFCTQVPNAQLYWEDQGEHDMSWWIQNKPDLLRKAFK